MVYFGAEFMFNKHDIHRDELQLVRGQARKGYDWWWHSFTAYDEQTQEARPFFIEFFLCNPASGGDKPVFGQLEENRKYGVPPSYLMVNVGTWGADARQLHRFFGWNQIKVHGKAPFSIEAEDCYLGETCTKGHVSLTEREVAEHPEYMCQSGEISWDLTIEKDIAFNVGYGAGKLFRTMQLFEMFWHAEGMKSFFEGTIIYNGRKYAVRKQDCYGYADKNWGKDFTSPWVWLSSNNLVSKVTGKRLQNSVFDIGGGCPKVGPFALKRKLLSAYYHEGQCYEFNFSKFWTFCRTKFHCEETETKIIWHVEQKTWRYRMVSDITCEKKDMLLINYEAPNGKKLHNRLWNGGNGVGIIKLYRGRKLLDEVEAQNIGCEYGEYGQ